ncbi:hypothetical protein M7I_5600 [Glarea lozoyensis 74030]|nr:hypothetical protein M7I_5600 [Glarea lozoyensis 74030]
MGKAIDIETGKISSFKDRLDEEMRGACDAVPRSPEESDDEYFAKVWEEISMQR